MPLPQSITLANVNQALRLLEQNRLEQYYPETGPLRRELYVKHMAFFAAGKDHAERGFIAANRVGKSEAVSCYELSLHATGRYPKWWKGKRFNRGIAAWAAGDTNQTTRDILQAKLCGRITRGADAAPNEVVGLGTGMIPGDAIRATKPKQGIPDAFETVYVRHVSGGTSVLTFKSYEQGRKSFQGTEQDVICLDEEPPEDVYDECLVRTMATSGFPGGHIILTFTPLSGWTKVIERFLNEAERKKANRFVVQAGWDDAPHLSTEEKRSLLSKLPAYQRDARSKGIPQLGSGAIYPVPETDIMIDPFEPPKHWPRGFGLDVGWNRTAVIWGAKDRESDTLYLYSQLYLGHSEASEVVGAMRSRGKWIPGAIDPAARGRSQTDGKQLIQMYKELGLDVQAAKNGVESGIDRLLTRMSTGRLKVFKNLVNWWAEFRMYRRDEKGRVVKENDHLMDATRYLEQTDRFATEPQKKAEERLYVTSNPHDRGGWMA